MSQAVGHEHAPKGPDVDAETGKDHTFPIFVDKQQFKVSGDTSTGAAVRALPSPPLGADRDLYLVVPGGDDILVTDTETVSIKPGTKFMSVPAIITPGRR